MDANAIFAYLIPAMAENLIDLEELAVRLGKNRTHLAACIRKDPNFPRLNTNTRPGAKRARYMFDWDRVKAYLDETGKDRRGVVVDSPVAPVAPPKPAVEDVDDLLRVTPR